jgi:hypothetical protein
MTEVRHVPFRALAVATLALGAIPGAFALSVQDPVQLAAAFFGWTVAMYLFAAGGALAAAFAFSRGEPMRSGWLLLSGSYLVLAPTVLRLGPKAEGLYEGAVRAPWVASAASILSGALAIAGFVRLARAWRGSGLDLGSAAGRLGSRLVAVAVAVALAGPDLVEQLPATLRGDVLAAGDVVTDVLDGALFVVAVPVLRAALALGGGLAAWPWMLLTASLTAWLGYDAIAIYGGVAGADPRAVRVAEEMLRTLGAAFVLAAGIAQRWVIVAARDPVAAQPAAAPEPGAGSPAAGA